MAITVGTRVTQGDKVGTVRDMGDKYATVDWDDSDPWGYMVAIAELAEVIVLSGTFTKGAFYTPDYDTAILATEPMWGDTFTTTDNVNMEWVTDMGTFESGYCAID